MSPCIKLEFADGRTEERMLAPGVYKVGRDVGDIVLGDPNASARHAELHVDGARVTILDVGSTNGTYDATGNRLTGPFVLPYGAPVRLGSSKITLLPQGPAAGGTRLMPAAELPQGPVAGGAVPPPVFNPAAPVFAPPAYGNSPLDPSGEDRTVAILSYLTLVGFIAAIIIYGNKKTALGAFHLRQALGYLLSAFACGIVLAIVLAIVAAIGTLIPPLLLLIPLIYIAFGASMLALWVLGLIGAINGQMKPLPVVGPLYQKWFSGAFR